MGLEVDIMSIKDTIKEKIAQKRLERWGHKERLKDIKEDAKESYYKGYAKGLKKKEYNKGRSKASSGGGFGNFLHGMAQSFGGGVDHPYKPIQSRQKNKGKKKRSQKASEFGFDVNRWI